jgi:hypothetical protein
VPERRGKEGGSTSDNSDDEDGRNDEYDSPWPPPVRGPLDDGDGNPISPSEDRLRWDVVNKGKGIFKSFLIAIVDGLRESRRVRDNIQLGKPVSTVFYRKLMRLLAPTAITFEDRFVKLPPQQVYSVSNFVKLQSMLLNLLLGGVVSRCGLNLDLQRMTSVSGFKTIVTAQYLAKVLFIRLQSGTPFNYSYHTNNTHLTSSFLRYLF